MEKSWERQFLKFNQLKANWDTSHERFNVFFEDNVNNFVWKYFSSCSEEIKLD